MLTTESKRITTTSRSIPFGPDGSAELRVPSLEMGETPPDTIDRSAAELPIETGDSDLMTTMPTFFTLQFDRRPLDDSADYALKLVMRSLNIVYSKQVIDRIGTHCCRCLYVFSCACECACVLECVSARMRMKILILLIFMRSGVFRAATSACGNSCWRRSAQH